MSQSCPTCRSARLADLSAEMIIHFQGLKHLDNPGVWLFSQLLVCLDCGLSRFAVPGTELASLAKVTLADRSATLKESQGDAALGNEVAC